MLPSYDAAMPRALYAVLAFLPTVGVLGVAIWTTALTHGRMPRELALGPVSIELPGLTADEAIPIAIAVVVTALVQIGTAIAFILHAQRNATLTSGMRVAWMMLVLFVGSIAQPVYWGLHVRGGDDKNQKKI